MLNLLAMSKRVSLLLFGCMMLMLTICDIAAGEIVEKDGGENVVVLSQMGDGEQLKRYDSIIDFECGGQTLFRLRRSVNKMARGSGVEQAISGTFLTLICLFEGRQIAEIGLEGTVGWRVCATFPVCVSCDRTKGDDLAIWVAVPERDYVEYIEFVDKKLRFPLQNDASGVKSRFLDYLKKP